MQAHEVHEVFWIQIPLRKAFDVQEKSYFALSNLKYTHNAADNVPCKATVYVVALTLLLQHNVSDKIAGLKEVMWKKYRSAGQNNFLLTKHVFQFDQVGLGLIFSQIAFYI